MSLYLGIDPGKSGGIATVTSNGVPEAHKMPPTETDTLSLITSFQEEGGEGVKFAVIEKVGARPGDGVVSMFKFGMGYGSLRMALIALGIPFEEVRPQTWQKGLDIPPRKKSGRGAESHTQFKNRLKAKAQQLFPDVDVTLAICDALLIAEFCRRTYQ